MSENEVELVSIRSELADKINKELVETNYYHDVKYNISSKSRWKIIADLSEAFANLLIAVTAILAFAAGFFNYMLLSFLAGCSGTLSFALLRFSSYSMKESKERTEQVNRLLIKLGIEPIADITIDSSNSRKKRNNKNINSESEEVITTEV